MCMLFFFKQKPAYEMRISDWSSDICSSDLDGVDIARDADGRPAVTDFVTGEWMRYSIEAPAAGRWTATIGARSAQGGTLALGDRPIALAASPTWQELTIADIALPAGRTPLILRAVTCGDCAVESLSFAPH